MRRQPGYETKSGQQSPIRSRDPRTASAAAGARRPRGGLDLQRLPYRSGLPLQRDTIAVEDVRGSYANLIATRAEDQDKPWVRKLVRACQAEEVRRFIDTELKGSLVPAFQAAQQLGCVASHLARI